MLKALRDKGLRLLQAGKSTRSLVEKGPKSMDVGLTITEKSLLQFLLLPSL